jgi:hypothetical protein
MKNKTSSLIRGSVTDDMWIQLMLMQLYVNGRRVTPVDVAVSV